MKQTIRKCLHWIASDARQTIADVKYAFRRRSHRVLLAVQMAAWVVILGEFIIMSICLDYSWFGEIVVIWYFILLITDSKHLLSVMQCVLSWIAAAAFTVIIFAHEMALWLSSQSNPYQDSPAAKKCCRLFHGVRHIKDTDWTQELFRFFNIRPGTADILSG